MERRPARPSPPGSCLPFRLLALSILCGGAVLEMASEGGAAAALHDGHDDEAAAPLLLLFLAFSISVELKMEMAPEGAAVTLHDNHEDEAAALHDRGEDVVEEMAPVVWFVGKEYGLQHSSLASSSVSLLSAGGSMRSRTAARTLDWRIPDVCSGKKIKSCRRLDELLSEQAAEKSSVMQKQDAVIFYRKITLCI